MVMVWQEATDMASLTRYYSGLAKKMSADIGDISREIGHAGETGRHNENVLKEFLRRHLPQRYAVTTGKVISSKGEMSDQIDIIIHDRLHVPALILGGETWEIVPIEATYGVISVRTRLNASGLRECLNNIASVRQLPDPAQIKPRSLIFGYESEWATCSSTKDYFVKALKEVDDSLRPHGLSVLEQCTITRKAYSLETMVFETNPLVHFFLFLVALLDSFTPCNFSIRSYLDAYPD